MILCKVARKAMVMEHWIKSLSLHSSRSPASSRHFPFSFPRPRRPSTLIKSFGVFVLAPVFGSTLPFVAAYCYCRFIFEPFMLSSSSAAIPSFFVLSFAAGGRVCCMLIPFSKNMSAAR